MKRTIAPAFLVGLLLCGAALARPLDDGTSSQRAEAAPRIDINTATAEQLVALPGIGEVVAARIVAYREKNGPFGTVEELMNVRGVGEKIFARLKDRLTVGSKRRK